MNERGGCTDPGAVLLAIPLLRWERELSLHRARAGADLFHSRDRRTVQINFTFDDSLFYVSVQASA